MLNYESKMSFVIFLISIGIKRYLLIFVLLLIWSFKWREISEVNFIEMMQYKKRN